MGCRPRRPRISLRSSSSAWNEQVIDVALGGSGLSYELVPAVDGRALSDADRSLYSSRRAMYEYGRELTGGMFGCALSHVKVLQRIVAEQIPEAVVFEDDTRPHAGFADLLRARASLPSGWDVVTFHSLFVWASPTP